jgi:hypothetical protein
MATLVAAAPKVSWLKRFGQVMGKILKVVSSSAKPIADLATPIAEALMPQFAPEIQVADNLVSNIAKQAVVTESIAATAAIAPTGPQKLATVLGSMGSEIDAWVQSSFPGAKAVSTAGKAGLVNAVVGILNEVDPAATVTAIAPVPAAVPASAPAK